MPVHPFIIIAEDHVIIRRGLKVILDAEYKHYQLMECDHIRQLMQWLREFPVTHLILDIHVLDGSMLEVLPKIKAQYPQVFIMVFTMSPEEIIGPRVIQLGADSFLSKQSKESEVSKALRLFLNRVPYLSETLQDQIQQRSEKQSDPHNPLGSLSDRELLVMQYLLEGKGVKEIATKLELKSTTVATYKARIFEKLGIENILELKQYAEIYPSKNST